MSAGLSDGSKAATNSGVADFLQSRLCGRAEINCGSGNQGSEADLMQAFADRERGRNHVYRLCRLKLASHFDLAALPEWDGPAGAPADVVCRLGEVPSRLNQPDYIAPIFQTRGMHEYLLTLPGTGRILVRNGNEITVEPEASPASSNLCAILSGPIQAVLWHQRELLPLHASVVVIRGRAIALCGDVAAGKSTLAAMLTAQGHDAIADDVCVVDMRNDAEASVWPGCTRLQLWSDALNELGVATDGLERALEHKQRYFLECGNRLPFQPYKLAAVVQLVRNVLPPARMERLRGALAANTMYDCVHTQRAARALGRAQPIFAAFPLLASAGVGFWRLMVPRDLAGLRAAAAKLLATLEN
jgi:hypothetical protein